MKKTNRIFFKPSSENGYTILLTLYAVAFATFIFSLSFLSKNIFQGSVWEDIYLISSTLLNPFYLFSLLFPVFYLLHKVFPGMVFKLFFFPVIGIYITYVIIDRLIFRLFKFHINSFVFKVFQQERALQVLGIGIREFVYILFSVIISTGLAWIVFLIIRSSACQNWVSRCLRNTRRKIVYILILLSILCVDKLIFAWMLYNKTSSVYILSKRIPFYIPLQAGRMFRDMGLQPAIPEVSHPSLKIAKTNIQYPLQPYRPSMQNPEKLPNIIFILSDALRFDAFTPEIMPNAYRYLHHRSANFTRHFSGSNGTTEGLFSMLYGLPPSYMRYFAKAEVSPVLFDALLAYGYRIKIYASQNLGWFGADQVIFSTVKEHIVDLLDYSSIKSDLILTDMAVNEIKKHKNEFSKPLFLFLFYDSPHLPHFSHPQFRAFQPSETSVWFDPSNAASRERGFNEYRNAVNYVDHLLGKVLKQLENYNYFDNSIVLLTGDHGSEKYEHGHWGHASAFTNEQLRTSMVFYYPGVEVKNIDRITSHMDLPVTILELLGESFDAKLHSIGQSLFDSTSRAYILAGGMANRVLIDDKYKIDYTPNELISVYKVTDFDDNEIENPDAVIAEYTPKILDMFDDFQRFLK